MERITTRENLESELSGCLDSAVLDYGWNVIAVWVHCFEGVKAQIYELIETPEETGLGRAECRISLIGESKGFEDTGHAVAWALGKLA